MSVQVFFRLPFSETIYNSRDAAEMGLSFTSFEGQKTINFRDIVKKDDLSKSQKLKFFSTDLPWKSPLLKYENKTNYVEKISKVVDFIKNDHLPKLVISRRKILNFSHNVDLYQSFLNLISNYNNAFVYLFKTETECWLGAFSEVLGKFCKKTSTFETMSLAGTLPLNDVWTTKEIEEQKTVTQYILNILRKYAENVTVSPTTDHISGDIKHLRTDFKLKMKSSDVENIISELHPTPAVCGIPKDVCKQAIAEFEAFPRELYAGYSRVETPSEVFYFVNLRCAKIYNDVAHLFVGGGITAQSQPKKEWQETELKSHAILKNLEFIS